MITQRISAGGIIVVDRKVLLVHHYQKDQYDFWVLPGGGLKGNEGIFRAAEREVWEETNLIVNTERVAYIEEFMDEGVYVCKFWVVCSLDQGELSTAHKGTDESFLVEAKFFSEEEISTMNVFPAILRGDFWLDLDRGFSEIKYLGYMQNEE